MNQNVSPCRGFSFRQNNCESAPWQKYCLYDSQYKERLVSTRHILCHNGMRALNKQPAASPTNFRQVPATSVTHQNSSFSRILNHAFFAPRIRPWSYHFPSSINVPAPKARAISFLNILTPQRRHLSETHRAKPILWTKTCHHVAGFLFDQKFAKAHSHKKNFLYDFRYKELIVSTSHILCHKRSTSNPWQRRQIFDKCPQRA